MSLLMDALRKAEEAKRAATQSEPAVLAEVAPAPEPPPDNAASVLQELGLEPLPPTVQETPPAHTTLTGSAAKDAAQRQTAQNAFAAKKAGPRAPEDKAFTLALAGVAGLAALSIGAYVWWQMQPRSSLASPPHLSAQPSPLPPAPIATTEAPAPRAANPMLAASAVARLPDTDAVERNETFPHTTPASTSPIRVTRSPARVNPLLEQGYMALQQGNLAQAQQAYERMLAIDARNTDALYGLAAIALQRQQPGLAEDYYLRILESDPRDAYAHAGLAGLRGRSAGSNSESRLKTLIADQPDVAPLHFALGNLYAQEQRWRDAQQSYFLAYQNDSSNPDTAFNLAVSLDQLHQNRLAAQYYSEALRLRGTQAGAFNREQVQARLRELQTTGVAQ
jgi:tetratricopeptide (TPR) repeat protein